MKAPMLQQHLPVSPSFSAFAELYDRVTFDGPGDDKEEYRLLRG